MTFRRILVPTDFSESADAALAHAAHLADRYGATLHLLHVVSELNAAWYGIGESEEQADDLDARIQSKAESRLQEISPESSSFDVHTEVVQRLNLNVTGVVLDAAAEHSIDLVVMGTRGHRGVGRLMLGSVAQTIVRRASCPVMTVRAEAEASTGSQVDYRHVLAPIDFSDHSRHALRLLKGVAARYGAHLHLMFVAEKQVLPRFSDTGLPGFDVVEMDPDIVKNAQAALNSLNEGVAGPDVESSYHVRKGDVAEEVIDFAETRGIDLISMATRGLTGITRFVLGSNTERVVRYAPCPVLTVRGEAEERE